MITNKGVKPNPDRIKTVAAFLGLVGYYRRLIENFSKITKPLTSLLKKHVTFSWIQSQQTAFETLKDHLKADKIVQFPNFTKPFILTTDASYATYINHYLFCRGLSQTIPNSHRQVAVNRISV